MFEYEDDDVAGQDEDDQVRQQLVEAIENQLLATDPACVQAVLNKLTLVGMEREEVVEMMAYVLAVEIRQSLQQERGFDAGNYERMLRELPELPADET
ncbi:hypothetical protein [Thiopseudomonas denitrificans]|uniref:Uncharacterized protein n=1 Tax=Thiopseudomonas denitrificans TaxID=1501432 RepID=A0A4V3D4M7_9GAMM|nr:hypothetical protein [Thiopseudomonas denitrificans]TDQ36877.1 hypothetical protein DFQ45_11092 [Thiopseudomonas denitrificans]